MVDFCGSFFISQKYLFSYKIVLSNHYGETNHALNNLYLLSFLLFFFLGFIIYFKNVLDTLIRIKHKDISSDLYLNKKIH